MTNFDTDQCSRRLCVAPMMDWTDRHCRYFHRLISPRALLYTEMVTTGAILHGDQHRHLWFNEEEHPVALQLGGSDPHALADCARIADGYGYDEVNLNVGCPSDRVQEGRFGACLMKEPGLVADCVAAMRAATALPVTVKHRVGVDDQDGFDDLCRFIEVVREAGCRSFIVHARKAWLSGLSPKQNREVPPLRYDMIRQVRETFPDIELIVNGGIKGSSLAKDLLEFSDGVMIGREAYHHPYILVDMERVLFGSSEGPTRFEVIQAMRPYVEDQLAKGVRLQSITRHILGLFQGQPGARHWRRHLSEWAHRKGAGSEVIADALLKVQAVQAAPKRVA
ncbi:MAG: tRNA dihydrouridine(20/20a) synthase DusA [Gammaproteobacteria bacterium]